MLGPEPDSRGLEGGPSAIPAHVWRAVATDEGACKDRARARRLQGEWLLGGLQTSGCSVAGRELRDVESRRHSGGALSVATVVLF